MYLVMLTKGSSHREAGDTCTYDKHTQSLDLAVGRHCVS